MKKKFFIFVCALCLMLPCAVIFSGCNAKQITMQEISSTLKDAEPPVVEGLMPLSYSGVFFSESTFVGWQRNFERNNIDTTEFMTMDYFYYYETNDIYSREELYCYVFKFKSSESAVNCENNFNFTDNLGISFTAKTYGNLVVACQSEVAEYVFDIVDNI